MYLQKEAIADALGKGEGNSKSSVICSDDRDSCMNWPAWKEGQELAQG